MPPLHINACLPEKMTAHDRNAKRDNDNFKPLDIIHLGENSMLSDKPYKSFMIFQSWFANLIHQNAFRLTFLSITKTYSVRTAHYTQVICQLFDHIVKVVQWLARSPQ